MTAATILVEPWPAGGWVVRLEGHPVPVSRHDTEEEAQSRAASYRRGLERDGRPAGARVPGRPSAATRGERGELARGDGAQ